MWVRNQSKTSLINCESFEVTDENEIVYGNPFDTYVILGEYSTKERCLEVLDEIEKHILNYTVKNTTYVPVVYQMPKEWENEKRNK